MLRFLLAHLFTYVLLSLANNAAWNFEYLDVEKVLDTFVEHLKYCSKLYFSLENKTFQYPYTSLVQSSGHGKSRLIKEASSKLYICYACIRKANEGYPEQTEAVSSLFTSTLHFKECTSFIFTYYCLKKFYGWLSSDLADKSCTEWYKYQINGLFWSEIVDETLETAKKIDDDSFPKLRDKLEKDLKVDLDMLNSKGSKSKMFNSSVVLYIALDEARTLL